MDPTPATNGLNEKIGPLPAYGWAVVAIGGFMAFRYLRNRVAPPVTTLTTPDPTGTVTGPNGDFGAPPLPGSSGISGIGTNQQWTTEASTALINTGKWTPAEVETALWGYLQGQALTGNGPAIINAALAEFGSPPEGNIAVIGSPVTTAGTGARPTFTNNNDWAAWAGQETITEVQYNPKPYGPADISNAIYRYISGQPLSTLDQTIINHVLNVVGTPPVPVAPPAALAHHVP